MRYPGDKTRCALLLLGFVLIGCGVFIALSGCGGGGPGSWFGSFFGEPPVAPGKDGAAPVDLTGPQELAKLLHQLKWLFIGLGLLAGAASFFVPLISTRNAVGSLIVGVCFGVLASFAKPIYWIIVACLIGGTLAAVWPFFLASITAFRKYVLGHDIQLTAGFASLQTLWKPRSAVLADSAATDRAGNSDGVSSPPSGGGAS